MVDTWLELRVRTSTGRLMEKSATSQLPATFREVSISHLMLSTTQLSSLNSSSTVINNLKPLLKSLEFRELRTAIRK